MLGRVMLTATVTLIITASWPTIMHTVTHVGVPTG